MTDVTTAVIVPSGFGVLAVVGAIALTAVAGCLPLRGGHGQHAGAGPGALTVHQLSGTCAVAEPEIMWPEEDPDELTSWLWLQRDRVTERLLEPLYLAEPQLSSGSPSRCALSRCALSRCAGARAPGVGGVAAGRDVGQAVEYVGRHRLRSITDTHHLDIRFHAAVGEPLPAA